MLSSLAPGTNNIIFCGDFNARIGDWVGDHDINLRGYRLRTWIRQHGITILNASLAFGLPTLLLDIRSSIVDLFLCKVPKKPEQSRLACNLLCSGILLFVSALVRLCLEAI